MIIRAITFHRAHNHGSVLQAYALQTFTNDILKKQNVECDYRIIDYHPVVQKRLYSVFKPLNSPKNLIKNCIALRHYRALSLRHCRFDSFVNDYLRLTSPYSTPQQLIDNPPEADVFVSGSDQIWNVRAADASPAYYLDFPTGKAVRISFAASFGPLKIDWAKFDKVRYSSLINSYDHISVREDGSADNVEFLSGKRPPVLADPTFLLSKEEWAGIENSDVRHPHPYILLYALEPTKHQLDIVDAISKKLGLPVVVLRYNNRNDWFNHYEKHYDAGPREFLSYVRNAELVLTTSFHGTAFSIIYQKPFYVIDGLKDSRIKSILNKTGFEYRSIEEPEDIYKVDLDVPDFSQSQAFIDNNRMESSKYLSKLMR